MMMALALSVGITALGCSTDDDTEGEDTTSAADTITSDATDTVTLDTAGDALLPDGTAIDTLTEAAGEVTDTLSSDTALDTIEDTAPYTGPPFTTPIGPVDETFYVGPYLMHTTQTTQAIGWETEEPGSTLVKYGKGDALDMEATGDEGTFHQLTLTGLEPMTLYSYQACTDGTCTATLQFSTAPVKGAPFRFAVVGDSQVVSDANYTVTQNIIDSAPVVVMHTGDTVSSGLEKDQFKTIHYDIKRQLLQYVPMYIAIGNHEKAAQNFYDYVIYPMDPEDPLSEASYAVSYGDVYFLVIDTNAVFFPLGDWDSPIWAWLNEAVEAPEASEAIWRFAFFHQPPDSKCYISFDTSTKGTREWVLPLLKEHGFQATFSGHFHTYEYLVVDGMNVFINGGGGGGLDTAETCINETDDTIAIVHEHHHLTVDITTETATVKAINLEGEVVDEQILTP